VLVLLGLQVFFFSSFVAVDLPTATPRNLGRYWHTQANEILTDVRLHTQPKYLSKFERYLPSVAPADGAVRYTLYAPQAPIAIFLGYGLGWPIATIAALLFILVGIVGPLFGVSPFAAGGGPDYYLQPGFGYLLGMVVATAVVAKITDEKRTSLRQLGALAGGIVSLHLTGLVYLIGSALLFALIDVSRPEWLGWVFDQARNLSWYPLPYDLCFSLLLIGASFPLRYLVGMLTAPDIALRTKHDMLVQQRIDELLH
jgi:biotin transporter BioY